MPHLTLSNRLFLVTAVAVLPSLVILALNLVTLYNDAETRLQDEAARSAKIATLEMNRIVGGVHSVLRAVANAAVMRADDVQTCNEYLARVAAASTELSDIAIADAAGNVVCRSGTSRTPISIADRDYFPAALAADGPVTGTYSVGRLSGRSTLPIAMKLGADTVWPGGVIAAGLDLQWLGARLKERDYAQNNALTIADRAGRILAREPLPEKFVGTVIPAPFRSLVTADAPGTQQVTSQDGTHRVIGYFPASDKTSGLYVSAGVSTDPVYAATNWLMLKGCLVALLGIAVAFLLARSTSNYFIRDPFNRLVGTVEAWERNELETRTDMGSDPTEFGRTGRALDSFMDHLVTARAELGKAERQREVLAREQDHRVKNIMATVQVVARLTFKGKGNDMTVEIFSKRLRAMASAHTVLMHDNWQSAPLSATVEETIAPFQDPDRSNFIVEGPTIDLGPKAAMSLAMALHELCTNALKYGALSVAAGQVAITWRIDPSPGSGGMFELTWTERNGPAVVRPSSRGFGSVMIEQVLAQQIDGSVVIEYRPQGLHCRITAPLEGLSLPETEPAPPESLRA